MNRKFIYLFVALLLPGLIFVFLKKFGKNEFDIPVKFARQRDTDSLNIRCATAYKHPYTIPDSVARKLQLKTDIPTVLVVSDDGTTDREFNRIEDTFSEDEYGLIRIKKKQMPEATFNRWTSCVFFIHPPWNIALIDVDGKIRGYYSAGSREEIDRLVLEMKILLKKY